MDKRVVYHGKTQVIDHETGEVREETDRKIVRHPRTPDFIMFFTKQIAILEQLTKTESSVLFAILSSYVGIGNMVFISPDVRKKISKDLVLDLSTISKALKGLKERKIIVGREEDGFTYLNPHLFGKGNWEEIHKMRQEMVFEFDFEKKETIIQRKSEALYGPEDQFEKPHKVIGVDQQITGNRLDETIHIQEMSESEAASYTSTPKLPMFDEAIDADIQEENTVSYLEQLREENRARELVNEEMKLKIKMHEMGIS